MSRIFIPCLMLIALAGPVFAAAGLHSARSDELGNPFIAVGVNPKTRVLTGVFSALYTAPRRTEVCRFLFRGALENDGPVRLAIKDAVADNANAPDATATANGQLHAAAGTVTIRLAETDAPGECEWMLGFIDAPQVVRQGRDIFLSVQTTPAPDFIGVIAVRSRRAFFHAAPGTRSVREAFLVAGDVAYVTHEQPGWYHIRFSRGQKQTTGWIRASDTVQF